MLKDRALGARLTLQLRLGPRLQQPGEGPGPQGRATRWDQVSLGIQTSSPGLQGEREAKLH